GIGLRGFAAEPTAGSGLSPEGTAKFDAPKIGPPAPNNPPVISTHLNEILGSDPGGLPPSESTCPYIPDAGVECPEIQTRTVAPPSQSNAPNTTPNGAFERSPTKWSATRPKGTGQTYYVYRRTDINWDRVRVGGDKRGIGLTNAQAAQKYGLPPEL